jgi:hypothetical protein
MKTDLTRGSEDDPEREALRAFLRHWDVAGPPPDLEEDLRRTFRRRRRSGRRPAVWLALAAGLALLALWRATPTGRPVAPERPVAAASPRPVPSARVESSPIVGRAEPASVPAPPARMRRAAASPPREADVIVEPGQAELLVRLGRELRLLRPAQPATTLPQVETVPADAPEPPFPRVPATDAPAYRATWETVAGEWPLIHRSVPGSGR